METEEYNFIKERLNEPNDVDLLNEKMGYDKDMLFNILARKIVRKVMQDYYKIKPHSRRMLHLWLNGKSFYEISKEMKFSPVLIAFFILSCKGMSKKEFQNILKNVDNIKDPKMKKDLKEALEKDFVYSPKSNERQMENGKRSEDKIGEWLDKHKIKYTTEHETKVARGAEIGQKTPDFLFDREHIIEGFKCKWVESKASFGSPNEIKRNYKKQFKPYIDLFGPGVVVYWYGFVDDVDIDKNFIMFDKHFFGVDK